MTAEDEYARDWNCLQCDAQMYNGLMDVEGDPDCGHSDREIISACCGAPVDEDIGFCPSCGEHA